MTGTESPEEPFETTTVVISGGGPTGALLSALLGQLRVPNIVLEREADITTDPRGIALDEDGIRLVQAVGMYERVHTRIGSCLDAHFISGQDSDFGKTPFLKARMSSTDGPTGHVGILAHKQPELERAIRDAVAVHECCQFRNSSTVVSIEENDGKDWMMVGYVDAKGEMKKLRAQFVVGADGKTGFVRKKFLEPRSVVMEQVKGVQYKETWVAINWHISLPTPETHPDFPLWDRGYTPEQVYDLFFPAEFKFLCNPKRPAVFGRFGLASDRLCRFEFVVRPGEDPESMASEAEIEKVVYPYLTHPGRRYGLVLPVTFPRDCITTLRARPFGFSARSCDRWALGRVAIAGDAAHEFPPFGGQGIASGFRDASGLAWRLALLHRRPEADHVDLLRGWYMERKQQLDASLALTVHNGDLVTSSSVVKSFVRDWVLWAIQFVPSWRRQMERGPRNKSTKYRYQNGLPFVSGLGGLNIPQVYAFDFRTRRAVFTDDLIFTPGQGLFRLLAIVDSSVAVQSALDEIEGLSALTDGLLREEEATVLVQDFKADVTVDRVASCHPGVQIARIASAAEFMAEPRLAKGRPAPEGYDAFRLRREVGEQVKYVVLRPDRFIYAACRSKEELRVCAKRLSADLHIEIGSYDVNSML